MTKVDMFMSLVPTGSENAVSIEEIKKLWPLSSKEFYEAFSNSRHSRKMLSYKSGMVWVANELEEPVWEPRQIKYQIPVGSENAVTIASIAEDSGSTIAKVSGAITTRHLNGAGICRDGELVWIPRDCEETVWNTRRSSGLQRNDSKPRNKSLVVDASFLNVQLAIKSAAERIKAQLEERPDIIEMCKSDVDIQTAVKLINSLL